MKPCPPDGKIISGFSDFDESLLSGESAALAKGPGEPVLGGSINLTQPLQMTVTATGADTVLAEIQRMIERAQFDKPPLARLADRIAAVFIVGVLLVVVAVAWLWWMHDASRWFEIALAVLIVSCPCALSLATPTAISASLGHLQGLGLLVKQGAALEKLNRVTHVVFDKTGTLTQGQPELREVLCGAEQSRETCLRLAAALERHSEHPLARVLVDAAGSGAALAVDDLCNCPGGGISARIEQRCYFIGSRKYISDSIGADIPAAWHQRLQSNPDTAVFLANHEKIVAMFVFADRLRDDAITAIAQLRRQGKTVALISGDRFNAVQRVAEVCGIDGFQADMLPDEKMHAVAELQRQGARVLMVGDGINDAPVLARADVSIAMGGATALAKTSADIVLVNNRLTAVGEIFTRAAKTQRVIRQNLGWALFYNFSAIPAAAAGLVAPWAAAIGMSLSSLLVVLNALRLTR